MGKGVMNLGAMRLQGPRPPAWKSSAPEGRGGPPPLSPACLEVPLRLEKRWAEAPLSPPRPPRPSPAALLAWKSGCSSSSRPRGSDAILAKKSGLVNGQLAAAAACASARAA